MKTKFKGVRDTKVVLIKYWREKAYPVIVVDVEESEKTQKKSSAKKAAFSRAREKFLNAEVTGEYDEFAWRVLEEF